MVILFPLSATQISKGLAGALIVEKQEEQQKPDQDITLMLHEWVKPESGHSMAGMDHSTMSSHDMSNIDHD